MQKNLVLETDTLCSQPWVDPVLRLTYQVYSQLEKTWRVPYEMDLNDGQNDY